MDRHLKELQKSMRLSSHALDKAISVRDKVVKENESLLEAEHPGFLKRVTELGKKKDMKGLLDLAKEIKEKEDKKRADELAKENNKSK